MSWQCRFAMGEQREEMCNVDNWGREPSEVSSERSRCDAWG